MMVDYKINCRLFFFLIFFYLWGGDTGYAKITPAQLGYLNDLLELNRMDEVIIEGERLKVKNQEDIELRALLFQAYLSHDLPVKAEEEIAFIESRVQNAQTLYLRALQAYHTNDHATALSFLDRITVKRYAPPYLLYFQIRMAEKKFTEAERYLEQYRELEGENNEWFFYYGQYLLARSSPEVGKDRVREHIQRYSRAFTANHRQMYLWADYYAAQEQFDQALDFIDKALYLSSSRPDYLDQKLYYLYRDHQFKKLTATIDAHPFLDKDRFIHYRWVKSFIHFINLKKEDDFSLLSPQYLNRVLTPLEEILEINPENELIRYLVEEILLANTDPTDPKRKPYAEYRYRMGQSAQSRGRWTDTQIAYARMLLLSPLEPRYREAELEYLRLTQQYESYKIEADNFLSLYPDSNQEYPYIPIRKQLAEKVLSETLAGRYALTEIIPPPHLHTLLTYQPRNYRDSWDQPYLETLAAKMIAEALRSSPLLQVEVSQKSRLIAMLTRGDYDYHIEFTLNDIRQILTLDLIIQDRQRNIIYQEPQTFYGKERYQKMMSRLHALTYELFPKIGMVSALKERQAVLSLGTLHGAQEEDRVTLYKNGQPLGTFPLEIVNNYYSLITIDKIFTLSQTEIGDRVILQKSENQ